MMITVIGRGHSGTRALSHTLTASGVYMGEELNGSGDLIPADDLYEACRVMARHVTYLGDLTWDFSPLHTMPIDPEFERLVKRYLARVLESEAPARGWKLPETTLIYPWVVRLFPEIRYIFWIRDPRDCVLGGHLTDDLADFGVPYDRTDDESLRRAVSWKYQAEIYSATPRPQHLLELRFEDFVLRQDETLVKLADYLDIPMAKIEVRPDAVGRWRQHNQHQDRAFFRETLERYGYQV
jgi:hypothetical protein